MTDSQASWEHYGGDNYKIVRSSAARLKPGVFKTSTMNDGEILFQPTGQNYDHVYNLPGLPIDFISAQVDKFWANAGVYRKYKFIHKRGILLYGPPGNGKTCVIAALIDGLVKADGVVLCVNEFSEASKALRTIKQIEPDRKVMTLMEDMDTLLSGEYKSEEPHALSMLDGQMQVNGVVHVATTNYPEALADRFIRRPGRFDLVIGMGMPVSATCRSYFQKILKDENHPSIELLVEKTAGLSLAYLREIASSYLCLDIPIEESVGRLKKNAYSRISIPDNSAMGFKLGYEGQSDDSGSNDPQG
jgi:hypothetical protein